MLVGMHVMIDLSRAADGRLAGVVHRPDGARDPFLGVLDLLRVLEEIEQTDPEDAE
jgi:hypothetical protein